MAYKEYRDPLYGFIGLTEPEQIIVDSEPFQRLRGIKQLGTTYLVYPTANHTRFEHSLGTIEIATRMFDALINNQDNVSILGWNKNEITYYRHVLRFASLLHDLGHPPFSHASESLFPDGWDHETYTQNMILNVEPIVSIINQELGDNGSRIVSEVATGSAKERNLAFLSELLTGDFGADRIDYLLRDSYQLGVAYGKFDAQRLLNTLHIRYSSEKEGPELAVEDGGVHSVEGFLLARYFMFLDVYFHKTRRIMDIHLTEFLRSLLPGEKYPKNLKTFLKWDDNRVMEFIRKSKDSPHTGRLLKRQHYRVVSETTDHPQPEEIERFDWLKSELEKNYDPEILRFDEARKNPYNFTQPPIFVFWRKKYHPLHKRSPLANNLRKIQKMRIYTRPDFREVVEDFCNTFLNKREQRR
ncbi:HD domain-containing protein [Moorella sulfitireducens]|uniref:HD domain-containing protein n=1 Tax=Neomoorella sulfitireducens TaxID=2972948 RepID=UPI0021AD0FE5|nr:HD domain-containing protein [Moorella sulfitireducens]